MTDTNAQTEAVQPVEQPQNLPENNNTPEKNEEQQVNWKKFRETREIERKAHDEALKRATQKEAEAKALKDAMEALLSKPDQRQQHQESYEEDEEEARIQKKIDAAIAARERQYEAERQQREKEDLPHALKRNYSDFDKVCTEENLDYLEFHYPEVASAFKYMPEGVEKWGSIYKAVKKFVPNSSAGGDKQRVERNLSKPQSASAGGATQVGDTAPIMLDDKRRADNWARMQKVIKGGR